ncbi:unnamed protein product [Eruca vesicaria subsp. sativa]|uniref:Uncharacterized protein n=1 Tax=Eruca vesicaria subsp. sativa TaxID=29727 RepID=A0ABC8KLY8_ERUVS|nr:unnamed protein product [Eruca vesicaria subsp. sativa]
MMIFIIFTILISSSLSPVSSKSAPTSPQNPIKENPHLPKQNNKQKPPLQSDDLNLSSSLSPPQSEASAPVDSNLDLHPSYLSSAGTFSLPPGDQNEVTAFSSHVAQGEDDSSSVVDPASKPPPPTATKSTRRTSSLSSRETDTSEQGNPPLNSVRPHPSFSSPQGRRNMPSKHRKGKEPMGIQSSTSRQLTNPSPVPVGTPSSPLNPYTKITTTGGTSSCSIQPHQSPHPSFSSPQGRHKHRKGKEPICAHSSTSRQLTTPSPVRTSQQPQHSPAHPLIQGHRIRHQTRASLLPLTAFTDGSRDPNDTHRIDDLSKCILNYFLMAGLSTTGAWAQQPALSTSIYVQCVLNQLAISTLLLAHIVVLDKNQEMALIMVRLSFALVLTSGYLSAMPMLAPYLAIIMLIVVAIACLIAHVFSD